MGDSNSDSNAIIDPNVIIHIARYTNIHEFLERDYRFEWNVTPRTMEPGEIHCNRADGQGHICDEISPGIHSCTTGTMYDVTLSSITRDASIHLVIGRLPGDRNIPVEFYIKHQTVAANNITQGIAATGLLDNTIPILTVDQKISMLDSAIKQFLAAPTIVSCSVPVNIPRTGLCCAIPSPSADDIVWCFDQKSADDIWFSVYIRDVFGLARKTFIQFTVRSGESEDLPISAVCGWYPSGWSAVHATTDDMKDFCDTLRKEILGIYSDVIIAQIDRVINHPRMRLVKFLSMLGIDTLMVDILGSNYFADTRTLNDE